MNSRNDALGAFISIPPYFIMIISLLTVQDGKLKFVHSIRVF